jgi:hypothetical protein
LRELAETKSKGRARICKLSDRSQACKAPSAETGRVPEVHGPLQMALDCGSRRLSRLDWKWRTERFGFVFVRLLLPPSKLPLRIGDLDSQRTPLEITSKIGPFC